MEIIEMKKEHEKEYEQVFKDAYFPYTLGFKKFIEEQDYETNYLLAIHDNKIVNAFCISKVGNCFYTPFGFAGGVINSRYSSELYQKVKEIAQGRGCYELAVVSHPFYNLQPPTQTLEWRFTQITNLENLVYPRTIRKTVNRARREGVNVFNSHLKTDLKKVHKICVESLAKRKDSTTHDFKVIKSAFENLNSELWVAKHDGKIIAGVMTVNSNNIIDYFMVGNNKDSEVRKLGGLELVIDEIINNRKARWMNWQGSCDKGTEFFKSRFRADKIWYPVFKHSLKEKKKSLLDKVLGRND